MGETLEARDLTGYEIHMGQTVVDSGASEPFVVCQRSGKDCSLTAGTARKDGLVFGTYIHGLFDNDQFRRDMLNILRRHKVWRHFQYSAITKQKKNAAMTVWQR